MDYVVGIGTGIGVAVGLGVVVPLLISRQRKQIAQVMPLLRERQGMTLDEIASATNTSVFGKGYLMQALDAMVANGDLEKVPPPAGHPRFRVLRDTKYQIRIRTE